MSRTTTATIKTRRRRTIRTITSINNSQQTNNNMNSDNITNNNSNNNSSKINNQGPHLLPLWLVFVIIRPGLVLVVRIPALEGPQCCFVFFDFLYFCSCSNDFFPTQQTTNIKVQQKGTGREGLYDPPRYYNRYFGSVTLPVHGTLIINLN